MVELETKTLGSIWQEPQSDRHQDGGDNNGHIISILEFLDFDVLFDILFLVRTRIFQVYIVCNCLVITH